MSMTTHGITGAIKEKEIEMNEDVIIDIPKLFDPVKKTNENRAQIEKTREIASGMADTDAAIMIGVFLEKYPEVVFNEITAAFKQKQTALNSVKSILGGNINE